MNQSKEARTPSLHEGSQQELLEKPEDIVLNLAATTKDLESKKWLEFTFEKQIVCRKCEGTTRVIENCRKCLGGEHTTFDDVQMVPLHCSECEGVSKRSYFDSITCDDCSGGLKTAKVNVKLPFDKELIEQGKCWPNAGNESRNRSQKPGNVTLNIIKSRLESYKIKPTVDSTKKSAQSVDEEQQRSKGDCNAE